MADLITIRTAKGVPFTVARDHAAAFEGLLNELEAGGYEIKADQSGGYNPRVIFGTNKMSEHSYGKAVDVNWGDNPRGKAGTLPPELARSLAAKHGLEWGGDWSNPDPMHFQVATGVTTQPTGQEARTAPVLAMVPATTGTPPAAAPATANAMPDQEKQSILSMLGAQETQPVQQKSPAEQMLAALDADEGVPNLLQMVPRRPARRMSFGRMRA